LDVDVPIDSPPVVSVLFWCFVLLGLVVGGLLLTTWVRRRVRGDTNVHGDGFTFSDLRQLRKQGKITELEYQRVKAALTASIAPAISQAEPGAPAAGAPPPGTPPVPRRSPPQT
jgi:hypothetical protein